LLILQPENQKSRALYWTLFSGAAQRRSPVAKPYGGNA
jgi:hypothetical protein